MIILKILGLIYKVPLSYILDDNGMGYFNSAYTVYTFFFMISSAGIPKAISILTPKYEAECNGSSSVMFMSLYKMFFILGLVLSFLLILFSKLITSFLSIGGSYLSLCAVAPSVFFVCISGVIRGYFAGRSSFKFIAISELIAGGGKLVFGLVLAYVGFYIDLPSENIAALTIFGITLGSLLSFLYLKHKLSSSGDINRVKISKKYVNISRVLKVSVPITLSSALISISSLIDLTIIMKGLTSNGYSELAAANLYGNYTTLTIPLFGVATTLINSICTAITPGISSSYAKNDRELLCNNINNGIHLALFIAIPCSVLYFFFSKEILYMIFDSSSAVLGYAFLSVIAPSLIFLAPLSIINTTLEATEKTNVVLISLSFGALIKLLFTAGFIENESFGLLSAPIGTFFSYAASLLISYLYAKKQLKFSFFKVSVALKITAISLISFALTLFLKYFLISCENIRLESLLVLLIFGTFYMLLLFFSSKEGRLFLTNYVKIDKKV